MQWGFQQTYLVGDNIDINTNNVWIPSTFYISPTNENTNVNLGTDLNLTSLQIQSGNFNTNNFNLELNEMRIGSLGSVTRESTATFGSSQIKTPRFIVHPDHTSINPGTSEIVIEDGSSPATVLFFGGGFTFYDITFIGVIDRIKDNNAFNTFTVMPGSELSFENGETQTANQFIFSGTSAQPISINSRVEGEAATIQQTSGTVNGNYLILQDNIATGGASFNASNSTDLGNVSGWNIEVTAPENYYWVGNSGNWSDLSHWSKTSGGAANHIDLPTAIDNIYFDANSFSNSTSVVNIDLELIFADNIYTAGTAPGTEIKAANTTLSSINIYGTMQLAQGVNYNLGEIHFLSDETQNITSNGSNWGFSSTLYFEGSGTFNLADDLTGQDISIRAGGFNSNGHDITMSGDFKVTPLDDPIVNLDNSTISARHWQPGSTPNNLSIENTTVKSSFIFYGEGYDYHKVIFNGSGNWVYGNFFAETLELVPNTTIKILPGDTVYINNFIANGTASEPITIESRTAGEEAYISKSSGSATGEHLIIRDNHAIGGASFVANNSTIEDNVLGWNGIVGLFNSKNTLKTKVYPNPVSNILLVEFEDKFQNQESDLLLQLFSTDGRLLIKQSILPSSENTYQMNIADFPAGLYHLVVTNNKNEALSATNIIKE